MSIERMEDTMHQLLPTSFNTLDIVGEETLSQVRQTLSRQMNLASKPVCCKNTGKYTVWTDVFSSYMKRKNSGYREGYHAQPLGDVIGLNTTFENGIYLGFGVGYAKDNVKWQRTGGHAKVHNGFASFYAGGWLNSYLYAQGALVGAMTVYNTDRFVKFIAHDFTTHVYRAKGHARGISGLGHFELGGVFDPGVRLRPFGKVDYSYLHRDQFTETGGQGIALRVKSHNADVLRAEAGIEILKCFKTPHETLSSAPYLIVGDAHEWRFIGESETASFKSITCPMTVNGFFPSQNLPFVEAGLIETFGKDFASFSMNYRQEWGHEYVNRSWSGQIRFTF
jgi:outer membrane autotransporter protein